MLRIHLAFLKLSFNRNGDSGGTCGLHAPSMDVTVCLLLGGWALSCGLPVFLHSSHIGDMPQSPSSIKSEAEKPFSLLHRKD